MTIPREISVFLGFGGKYEVEEMSKVCKQGQLVLLAAYETYVTCRKTLHLSISSPLAVKIEECGWRWNRADCAP